MSVTERMRSLGDHAKSSRQPPLKERKRAKADESATQTVGIDEDIFDDSATRDNAAVALVDDMTPQIVVESRPAAADDSVAPAEAIQEDADLSAAKRAIIHEWENWSALHSDELDDPNVGEYFFRHLQANKPKLLIFSSQDKQGIVRSALGHLR